MKRLEAAEVPYWKPPWADSTEGAIVLDLEVQWLFFSTEGIWQMRAVLCFDYPTANQHLFAHADRPSLLLIICTGT